jgi:hypothetical protein
MYYDGRENLSAVHIDCPSLDKTSCFGNKNCGFCSEEGNGRCVDGNAGGPLSPCVKQFYRYIANAITTDTTWSPFTAGTINTIHVDKDGNPTRLQTATPDMTKVFLNPNI